MPPFMLPRVFNRLENIARLDRAEIDAMVAGGKSPIIQFSKPDYSAELLDEIDAACQQHGDKLEVRFYSHSPAGFDARWLARLPNVAALSIDCLLTATNLNALSSLSRLKRLSLGIFDLGDPDILSRLPLEQLEELSLGETRKSEIELSPLSRCRALRRLSITGHTRGFDALAKLERVADLTLRSIPKKQTLAPVSHMRGLRSLTMRLGGRVDIGELAHPLLERLDLALVRGLTNLGNLSRFSSLEHLQVEGQLQLRAVDLGSAPSTLQRVRILNCRNLGEIGALAHLSALTELRVGPATVDFNAVLRRPLPPSLRYVSFLTGSKRADHLLRERLEALGYARFSPESLQHTLVRV